MTRLSAPLSGIQLPSCPLGCMPNYCAIVADLDDDPFAEFDVGDLSDEESADGKSAAAEPPPDGAAPSDATSALAPPAASDAAFPSQQTGMWHSKSFRRDV